MTIESKMRVIHVCPYDYDTSGGHSNAIRSLAEGQVGLSADVTVLSYQQERVTSERNNSKVKTEVYQNDGELISYVKDLELTECLVISFCGVRPLDVACARVCRKRGIKYVFSSGGALHYRSAKIWVKKFAYVNFLTQYFRGASGLIVTTEFERARLSRLLPCYRGAKGVIPNIIEVPTNLPAKQGHVGSGFVFGFMGRLDVYTKGLDYLIEAFAGLEENGKAKLVIVGPDHHGGKEALSDLVEKYGVKDRVEIRDPAYGDDKELFFSEIDCFVSISRWEAFGISFVEAMSRGVATIISDQVNLKIELQRNKAAALVPLNTSQITKEMMKMMKDKSYRMTVSESGEKWASGAFQQRMVAEDSLKFYGELK